MTPVLKTGLMLHRAVSVWTIAAQNTSTAGQNTSTAGEDTRIAGEDTVYRHQDTELVFELSKT